MRDTSIPLDSADSVNVGKTDWTRWVVPVVLLVLVATLVGATFFFSRSPNAWSTADTVLFILTALLCTLVTAYLTLTGCSRWLSGIERSLQPLATEMASLQETQTQLGIAIHKAGDESNARAQVDERNQHLWQDQFSRLATSVQTVTTSVTSLREMLQTHTETTRTSVAGLADGYGKLVAQVQTLRELSQKNVGPQTDATREPAEATRAAITGLATDFGKLADEVRSLAELSHETAAGVTDIARDQAAAQSAWQDSVQVLSTATEAVQQGQQILLAEIEKVAKALQQIREAVTATAANQAAAQEATRQTLAEMTGLGAKQEAVQDTVRTQTQATDTVLATLAAQDQQRTAEVQQLHELTRTVADGVAALTGEQTAARRALQDGTQALADAVQAIGQSQDTLRKEVEKAVQTAEQIIGTISTMALEQTTARETTRNMVGEVANAAIAALTTGRVPHPQENRQMLPAAVATTESRPLDAAPPEMAARSAPLRLSAAQALTHGEQIRYEIGPDRDNLGFWANPSDWAQWDFDLAQPGRFQVTAEIAAVASGRFQLTVGDQRLEAAAPTTGDYGRFERVELGVLNLPASGLLTLAVHPIPEGWRPMNLKALDLTPLT